MRILVCGDRDWTDYELIERWLRFYGATLIIEGGQGIIVTSWKSGLPTKIVGADACARHVARSVTGLPSRRIDAEWGRFGLSAGPRRNQKMLDTEQPERVLGFHTQIERSKGTKDMLRRAKAAGIPTRLITHSTELGHEPEAQRLTGIA
jgi:hypothetical protein